MIKGVAWNEISINFILSLAKVTEMINYLGSRRWSSNNLISVLNYFERVRPFSI